MQTRPGPSRVRPARLPGGGAGARLQQERQGEPRCRRRRRCAPASRSRWGCAWRWPTAGTRTGRTPRDSGLATKLKWSLPEGFAAGEIAWPHPERISVPPLMSYGYERRGGAAGRGHACRPAWRSGEPVRLAARADWLECKEICLPGKAELEITLPVDGVPSRSPRSTRRSSRAAARGLPGDAGRLEGPRARGAAAGTCSRSRRPAAPRDAYFFSDAPQVVEYAAPQKLAARRPTATRSS